MDRKVSNLSIVSDTSSDYCPSPRAMNLIIENIGQIPITETTGLTSFKTAANYVCMLSGENKVFVAELKLRADSDCLASRSALLELPGVKEEKRFLDCAIVVGAGDARLVLLGERKNKERFVSVVEVVTSGRSLSLSREMAVYDKASMLGKGLTHVTAAGESDVFTCGNLIRKLKMEEGGNVVKPTTGRVQVPPECVDGTLCLCVVSASHKNSFTIICSFRTKSASKNKYQINWYQGRNDEISAPTGKSSLKLSEDQEPTVIMSDPRDARSVYVICNNASEGSSSLYKLARGRKLEEPITTFTFPVTEASLMLGTDKNLFLLVLDSNSSGLKVFHVMKTQGYRGSQAVWSKCPELQSMSPNYHAVSCSLNKWQLSPNITDTFTSQRCPYQLGLATLVNGNNDIVNEPESGSQYRLRAVGGDAINDVILIILDDIERCFESEEDQLSDLTLKICMNSSPGRDGLSLVSGWLMSGRLSCVELYCTRLDNDAFMDSDRLMVQTFPTETFRSYFLDQDWTQKSKREGTFVLDSESSSRPSSGRASTSTPIKMSLMDSKSRSGSINRIPTRKQTSSTPDSSNHLVNGKSHSSSDELIQVVRQVEETLSPLARANSQIRDSLGQLEASLMLLKSLSVDAVSVENNNNGTCDDSY